ncbi:MAG TPA: response regulator transcription factor [Chloroflexota bacterium]|nr:response regulator transcription factor [Chloroflexota bacterium]
MATERPAAATARLVIADDHDLARAGLRSMLAGERGLAVVGEAANGREALALARRLQPDLVLMDVRMPEMDGLAATRAIKAECPRVSVVIVTMHENLDYLFEALKAGAAGYLLKDATQREVVSAVRQVLRGESLLNGELATRLLHRLAEEPAQQDPLPTVPLTPREAEVLRLLAQGLTNREIAGQLYVSVGTVKVHVERILAKLGVSDRTQAAVRAVTLGLAQPSRS